MVSPALDAGSTTVEVWLKIDNKAGTLKVGTPVKVSITGRTVANAWKMPDSAIVTAEDGTKLVMVVGSDGAAHGKPVTLGIDDGTDVQVVSGIAPSDLVITVGAYGAGRGHESARWARGSGRRRRRERLMPGEDPKRVAPGRATSPSGWPAPRGRSSSSRRC